LAVRWRHSGAALGDLGDDFAVGGIGNRNRFAAIGVDPLAVDVGFCLEQGLVGKLDRHV
jgi:hypothetical protein